MFTKNDLSTNLINNSDQIFIDYIIVERFQVNISALIIIEDILNLLINYLI